MKLTPWRLLPLCLIIWTFSAVVRAKQQEANHGREDIRIIENPIGDKSQHNADKSHSEGQHEGDGEQGKFEGAAAVQQALAILQSIRSPRSHLSRFDKPSGIFGTTVYYAKKGFVLLFVNGPSQDEYSDSQASQRKLNQPLANAVKLLDSAAKELNTVAISLLADMNFFGNYSHPRNFKEAFRRYQDLASLNGNSTAQYMVGFMYATGIGGSVERSQPKALVYHTFAALGGNTKSEMTIAYRHHTGIGTPRNCNEASSYYKKVADKAVAFTRSGPPGGVALHKDAFSLADEDGGVYGEGASVVSSGVRANKAGPNSDQHAAFDDVLEYLDLMSRKGDLKATFSLGRLHYDGSRTMKRNLKVARDHFYRVARKYWSRTGAIVSDDSNGTGKIASKAAGYIGRMYLRAEGVKQDFGKALIWFKRGVANGDALCQYELGLMYLKGLGVRQDAVTAADYFKEAASQDVGSAQTNLGQLFLDQGDVQTAIQYFEHAARQGHIEALYHLAEISNNGVGRERSCGMAVVYYKVVAEKVEAIHSSFSEANEAYEKGDMETALVLYMMAAEQGYENAQANVAWILDEHKSIISLDSLMPIKKKTSSLVRNAVLALIYWTRSAKQSNIDSMVKTGDYYLGGYGVDADMEKAATCYQTAAEFQQSAQALWNLGWMHENGIGVSQDFHLAKRFYDQALETNQESYLPVKLSLLKLRWRSAWNTITHGKINSIQSEPTARKSRSLSEWISHFAADSDYDSPSLDNDDDLLSADPGMPGGDNEYYDEVDEGIIESLVILGLAFTLAFLVYYRQQRQGNARRAREQQGNVPVPVQGHGQGQDGGFFPRPGDPEFAAWAAGGVGH